MMPAVKSLRSGLSPCTQTAERAPAVCCRRRAGVGPLPTKIRASLHHQTPAIARCPHDPALLSSLPIKLPHTKNRRGVATRQPPAGTDLSAVPGGMHHDWVGTIDPFPRARTTTSEPLLIPEKLYGRSARIAPCWRLRHGSLPKALIGARARLRELPASSQSSVVTSTPQVARSAARPFVSVRQVISTNRHSVRHAGHRPSRPGAHRVPGPEEAELRRG